MKTKRNPKKQDGVERRFEGLLDALTAIRVLVRGRVRAVDLADELDATTRTAHRVLAALQRAGLDLQRSPEGREVYWSTTRESVERLLGLGQE